MQPIHQRPYRTREFSQLTGVTVRTLHHYDRIGRLIPGRSQGGHRLYSARDLEALEQIIALKRLGVPLKTIPMLRRAGAATFATALRAQRRTLETKRDLLDRAIRAIRRVERGLRAASAFDPTVFTRILELTDMQNTADWKIAFEAFMEEWADRRKTLSHDALAGLAAEKESLTSEIDRALNVNPDGPKAQALGRSVARPGRAPLRPWDSCRDAHPALEQHG